MLVYVYMYMYFTVLVLSVVVKRTQHLFNFNAVHIFMYTVSYTTLIEGILLSEIFMYMYFHYSMVMNTCLRLSPSGVSSVHGLPTYWLL